MSNTASSPYHQRLLAFLLAIALMPGMALAAEDDRWTVDLDPALLDLIETELPDSQAVSSEYLSADYTPNLVLEEDAQIQLTAIDKGTGRFGYFAYETSFLDELSKADFDLNGNGVVGLEELDQVEGIDVQWAFNGQFGGPISPGDTVNLGGGEVFAAGTSVSFFFAQNASGNDNPNSNSQTYYSLDFLNPEAASTAGISAYAADDKTRHTVTVESDYGTVFGFEDLTRVPVVAGTAHGRLADDDFNDALFVVSTFDNSDVPVAPVEPMSAIGAALLGLCAALGRRRRLSA